MPPLVCGDRDRLRQIVVNLVGNAIKFTERGEVELDVWREGSSDGEVDLHFAVRDTGIGIPAEKQKAIFEVFEQADASMTRRFGGSGLGLAIASRLVDLMHGRLWVESEVGRGSTFHFTARLALASEEAGAQSPLRPAMIQGTRVLVVDDNAANRQILEEILRSWAMEPASVPGGEEALAALREARRAGTPYRLVLTDAQMPGMSGFTLAEKDPRRPGTGQYGHHDADLRRSPRRRGPLRGTGHHGLSDEAHQAVGTSGSDDAGHGHRRAGGGGHGGECRSRRREPLRTLHILLAEDSLVNQKLAVALLETHGHAVTVVGNGRDAVGRRGIASRSTWC